MGRPILTAGQGELAVGYRTPTLEIWPAHPVCVLWADDVHVGKGRIMNFIML